MSGVSSRCTVRCSCSSCSRHQRRLDGGDDVVVGAVQQVDRRRRQRRSRRRQRRIAAQVVHERQQHRSEPDDVAGVDVVHVGLRRFGERSFERSARERIRAPPPACRPCRAATPRGTTGSRRAAGPPARAARRDRRRRAGRWRGRSRAARAGCRRAGGRCTGSAACAADRRARRTPSRTRRLPAIDGRPAATIDSPPPKLMPSSPTRPSPAWKGACGPRQPRRRVFDHVGRAGVMRYCVRSGSSTVTTG